jgi:hypothetical protein
VHSKIESKMKRTQVKQTSGRTAFGAGLITLDIIIQQQETPSIAHAAGGTCGNVIAALAYLGWDTTPVGRLGDDAAGNAIRHEFSRLGVSARQLTREDALNSARIVQFIVERRNGIQHRFGFSCPTCGNPFSRFRPPTLEQAETVLAKQEAPDVFFFDRVSAAILAMASEFRKRGTLIYFEPPGVGRPAEFSKALAVAYVEAQGYQVDGPLTRPADAVPFVIWIAGEPYNAHDN